jgi:energy-coupling factor transporter ATP-binding protein EcfA2
MVNAKLAFLISGGTGSGKTTLLNALLALVPSTERVLVVEDSRELAPDHPHVIRLEARPPNAELVGAALLKDEWLAYLGAYPPPRDSDWPDLPPKRDEAIEAMAARLHSARPPLR